MNKKAKTIGLLIVLMIHFSCTSQKRVPTNSIQELNKKIENIFSKAKIAGISVIVVDKHKTLFQKSMGFADIEKKAPYTNQTIQSIASISKTFVALALMKAVELGKLRLDDDVNMYLPFKIIHPKYPKTPITVRHLTNHTSGIIDGSVYNKSYVIRDKKADLSYLPSDISGYVNSLIKNEKIDDTQFLENMLSKNGKWYTKDSFGNKAPGKEFNYSNVGSALVAYIIENAVGFSFEDFTKREIFEPLKMTNTGWDLTSLNKEKYASKYFNGEGLKVPEYELVTKADGGLITSSDDFGKYLQEMLKGYYGEGTLLSKKSYKEMYTRNVANIEKCGIFWEISDKGNPNHNGGDPGVFTNTVIMKDKEFGIFIMCNGTEQMNKVQEIFNTVLTHKFK